MSKGGSEDSLKLLTSFLEERPPVRFRNYRLMLAYVVYYENINYEEDALMLIKIFCIIMVTQTYAAVDFDHSMEFINGIHDDCNYEWKGKREGLAKSQELMIFLKNLYTKNIMLAPEDKPLIPKKIHQIWLGTYDPPAVFKESQESIKKYHPDWDYKLWRDADIEELDLQNKQFYNESTNYGERSDIARYEILYRYGGLYLDIDVVCLKPFNELNHTYDFYTGLMPLACDDILGQRILGSVADHPIVKACIDSR